MRGIIGELEAGGGVTIVDMEAGLELFGRGTPGPSDLLISVVEPSLWSVQTAARIAELATELGIPKLVAVANKVGDDTDVAWIREALRAKDVEVVAVVPFDPEVSRADRKMQSLLDIAPGSPAAQAIATVADVIEAEIRAASAPAPEAGGNGHDGAAADNGCPWVVDAYH